MSLSTGRNQLSNAFKKLAEEWDATANVWRDVVRKDFAEHHWDPLAMRLVSVLTAIDTLDQEMTRMKHDCE